MFLKFLFNNKSYYFKTFNSRIISYTQGIS